MRCIDMRNVYGDRASTDCHRFPANSQRLAHRAWSTTHGETIRVCGQPAHA
jgi:hypothetical protein